MEYSRPGKPTDNAMIESFNGTLRDECLNVHWFDDLTDAQRKLQAWQREYNETRPHWSLNELSPQQFKALWAPQNVRNSLTGWTKNGSPSNPGNLALKTVQFLGRAAREFSVSSSK